MSENILVPLDGSGQAYNGLEQALEDHPDGDITVLYVVPTRFGDYPETIAVTTAEVKEAAAGRADTIFERAREIAENAGHGGGFETMTADGKPSREIVEAAEESDRIVMGSHGRETPREILLGSTAEKVVRRSPVSVLIVR